MDVFFKSLLSVRDQLSDLEKQVLDYFLENPEIIETHTLEEISEKIFVSTATISRTCKKLGFNGFQEWKYSFLTHREQIHSEIKDIQTEPSINEHIKRFEREFKASMSVIGCGINDELINQICKSNHVEFFGVGSSLPLCVEGARKMTFANRIATARSDWDELRVVAKNLNEQDLAIIVSLSGETLHIIDYANILQKNNVPILAIIGNENSRLEKIASFILTSPLQTTYYNDVDMSSRFPLSMIIDLLILELINYQEK